VKHSSSHRGSQEADRDNACTGCLSSFPSFIPLETPAYGIVLSISRVCLPFLVNPLGKCTHRHTQRCVILISKALLNPIS
jgi:hypothetical protein